MFKYFQCSRSNSAFADELADVLELALFGVPRSEDPTSEEVSEAAELELVIEPTVAILDLGDDFLPFVFFSEKRVDSVSVSGIEPTVAILDAGDDFFPFTFLPIFSEKRVETVSSSGIDSTVCLPICFFGGIIHYI
jgi:hypothetical protein